MHHFLVGCPQLHDSGNDNRVLPWSSGFLQFSPMRERNSKALEPGEVVK